MAASAGVGADAGANEQQSERCSHGPKKVHDNEQSAMRVEHLLAAIVALVAIWMLASGAVPSPVAALPLLAVVALMAVPRLAEARARPLVQQGETLPPCRVVLVRHGESCANLVKRHGGRFRQGQLAPDPSLTARGVAQAAAAGHELRAHIGDEAAVSRFLREPAGPYDAPRPSARAQLDAIAGGGPALLRDSAGRPVILASPLLRAMLTACLLADALLPGVDWRVVIIPGLTEWPGGVPGVFRGANDVPRSRAALRSDPALAAWLPRIDFGSSTAFEVGEPGAPLEGGRLGTAWQRFRLRDTLLEWVRLHGYRALATDTEFTRYTALAVSHHHRIRRYTGLPRIDNCNAVVVPPCDLTCDASGRRGDARLLPTGGAGATVDSGDALGQHCGDNVRRFVERHSRA